MQTFKKLIISIVSFLLVIIIVSVILIVLPIKNKARFYNDADYRKDLSGTIDFLTVGASHCLSGFKPEVIDEELGVFSYNLSGVWMPLHGRYYLLQKELKRNDVDTVVLELSYDALTLHENHEHSVGDTAIVQRLDSFGECLAYLNRYVAFDEWLNIYSRLMSSGATYYEEALLNHKSEKFDENAKGYRKKTPNDITLSKEKAEEIYNSTSTPVIYDEESIMWLDKTIELCKNAGVRLIVTVIPISDKHIWSQDNLDFFRLWITEYCEEKNCTLYDFNLYKDRWNLFSDKDAFNDNIHMSDVGANTFTKLFADFLKNVDSGKDISELFYSSYEEMKKDSPYANMMN